MPEELKDAKYVITRRAGEDFKLVQHPNCNTFNHRKSLRWSGIKAVQIDDFVPSILNQTPATTQLKVNDNFIINDYFDYIENTNISKYMKVIDDVLLQKNGTQKTSAMDRYFEYSYINISPLMCLGYDTIITAIPNIHPENSEFSLTEIEKLYLTPFDERNRTNNIFKMYAGIILEHYIFETFESMFRYCILHMIENNIMLKKCENCGKYFYPASRSDEKYCNNVLKNGKTCRQLGYEIKVNNDELLKHTERHIRRLTVGKTVTRQILKILIQHFQTGIRTPKNS